MSIIRSLKMYGEERITLKSMMKIDFIQFTRT
jgi:hypothetical protein